MKKLLPVIALLCLSACAGPSPFASGSPFNATRHMTDVTGRQDDRDYQQAAAQCKSQLTRNLYAPGAPDDPDTETMFTQCMKKYGWVPRGPGKPAKPDGKDAPSPFNN